MESQLKSSWHLHKCYDGIDYCAAIFNVQIAFSKIDGFSNLPLLSWKEVEFEPRPMDEAVAMSTVAANAQSQTHLEQQQRTVRGPHFTQHQRAFLLARWHTRAVLSIR
jgi:hypothetical protein